MHYSNRLVLRPVSRITLCSFSKAIHCSWKQEQYKILIKKIEFKERQVMKLT
jgi:hypothetical protein